MLTKELARTGLFLTEVGIGTSNYRAGPQPLRKCIDAGVLFFDTAESYGSDQVLGEAVKDLRVRVFLATKVSPWNFRPSDFRASVDASLQRLGTDYIDLLQLHEPNPQIPITETMGAMADVVAAGKVRYAGVSNFSVAQLQEAQQALGAIPLVSNQVRYNLIDRTIEGGLLPYCQANRITVIAYTPLARGLARIRDCDPSGIVDAIARESGKSPAQVVLNWCLSKQGVVAIPGSNSGGHLLENCGASDWRLTAEQMHRLNTGIQYRRRNRVDVLLRRSLPPGMTTAVLRIAKWLPRGIRRRFT